MPNLVRKADVKIHQAVAGCTFSLCKPHEATAAPCGYTVTCSLINTSLSCQPFTTDCVTNKGRQRWSLTSKDKLVEEVSQDGWDVAARNWWIACQILTNVECSISCLLLPCVGPTMNAASQSFVLLLEQNIWMTTRQLDHEQWTLTIGLLLLNRQSSRW